MEAGLGSEWGRNEGYGCRYFAGGSGLEPPFPFHKQCLAYFRSSNAMAESFNAKTDSSEPVSEGLLTRGSSCSVLLTPTYMHIPAEFRQAKSSPSVKFRGRTCHYTFSLRCSSLTFNNFQNHKKVRRTEISLKGQTS